MDGKAEPALRIVWYATPEEVDAAMWAPALAAEGLTREDLAGATYGAETEDGETVVVSQDDVMQGMHAQGCWGWVDTATRTIHAWAAADADPALVMHMLAHEIGHVTGKPLADDMAEEARAEAFGAVAAQAFRLFAARQPAACDDAVLDAVRDECQNMRWPSTALAIWRKAESHHGIGATTTQQPTPIGYTWTYMGMRHFTGSREVAEQIAATATELAQPVEVRPVGVVGAAIGKGAA